MSEQWVERLAARFWEQADLTRAYPAPIEEAIGWALPLDIRERPRLTAGDVLAWAAGRGIALHDTGPDRRLRGCLIARRGSGTVWVDAADPPAERRFTLAHEAAHFMVEHEETRRRAVDLLGPDVLAALDGDRAPTRAERAWAAMAGVTLGVQAHLMERGPGGAWCSRVEQAECAADRLALELLAPAERARPPVLAHAGGPWAAHEVDAAAALVAAFDLPEPIARAYARHLLPERARRPSFREWLGRG